MSARLYSHQSQTLGLRDRLRPDLLYLSPGSLQHRDPGSEVSGRPGRGSSRWNTVAPLLSFVFSDLPGNFIVMRSHIRPRIRKIFGAQSRIGLQKVRLTGSKPPRLFEQPYRDAGANNARFASAHISATLNSGKSVSDIARRPLKQLCLFRGSQFAEQLFGLFQSAHRRCKGAARRARMQAALS